MKYQVSHSNDNLDHVNNVINLCSFISNFPNQNFHILLIKQIFLHSSKQLSIRSPKNCTICTKNGILQKPTCLNLLANYECVLALFSVNEILSRKYNKKKIFGVGTEHMTSTTCNNKTSRKKMLRLSVLYNQLLLLLL